MKLYWFIVSCIGMIQSENLCKKIPRAPSPGCCPDAYLHLCCLGIPPCNASKVIPASASSITTTLTPRRSSKIGHVSIRSQNITRYPCSPPWTTPACAKGFYLQNGSVEACPSGFYCPERSTCLFPCPSGAYCMQYQYHFQYLRIKKLDATKPLCKRMGICCVGWHQRIVTPTEIILKNGSKTFKCPGMSSPKACPKGYYCPDTTTRFICKRGHYCPQGSVKPTECMLMAICNEGESAPLINVAGPTLAILLAVTVAAAYMLFVHFSRFKFYCQLYVNKAIGTNHGTRHSFSVTHALRIVTVSMNDLTLIAQEQAEIQPKDYPMDIAFKDLSLTLKSHKRKMVLSGVTGSVLSGEVTAVMGPSGAGKTTFLNALSGKAYYGNMNGKIIVNGQEVNSLSKYRKITGFVPQEGIMHRKLTVQEVLMFQGRLRMPGTTPARTIKHRVDEIMKLLEIAHVANTQIGDEESRGISGGQRKRVNIGMELVADPTLLFLDEPTSGLDSTSSLSVLRALRKVAEKGRLTVVCVIHQPRYEIFVMFHKLLFLGPGGRTVYQGDVDGAREYFDGMGYPCPANVNPADHYMDVIGGVVKKNGIQPSPRALFDEWNNRMNARSNNTIQDGDNEDGDDHRTMPEDFHDRPMPNVFLQFSVFLKREAILQFRNIRSLMLDMFMVLLAGGIVGGLYAEVSLERTLSMHTMSSLAIGLTATLGSLRCFGNHRTTFWRESAAGINRFSYFLAVNICQLPIIMIAPLFYLSLQYTFTAPRALFKHHYAAVLMAQFVTSAFGYAISGVFSPRNSQMASVVLVLISSLLSGSMPTLCRLNDFTVIGPIAYSLSYCRWFVEALFEKEVERYPSVLQTSIDLFAFNNNYDLESYGLCMIVLFAFGIVLRVVAYILLIFTNRGQQR